MQVYSPAVEILTGIGVLLSVCVSLSRCVGHCNSPLSQSIGAIPASQDLLLYILTRIERSFHLLEIHIEVPPTSVMVAIMVEVLSILATVTKDIKQGRTSESWQYTLFLLTYDCV